MSGIIRNENDGNVMQRLSQGNSTPLPNELKSDAPLVPEKSRRDERPTSFDPPPFPPSIPAVERQEPIQYSSTPNVQPSSSPIQETAREGGFGGFGNEASSFDFGAKVIPPAPPVVELRGGQQQQIGNEFSAIEVRQASQPVNQVPQPPQPVVQAPQPVNHVSQSVIQSPQPTIQEHRPGVSPITSGPAMIPSARLEMRDVSSRDSETKTLDIAEKTINETAEDSKKTYDYESFRNSIPDFEIYDAKMREHVKDRFRSKIDTLSQVEKNPDITLTVKKQHRQQFKKEAQEFTFAYCKKTIQGVTDKFLRDYVKYVIDDMYFFSVLTDLIERTDIDEISAPSYSEIYIIKRGEEIKTDLKFRNNQHMKDVIDSLTSFANRKLNDSTPNIECRLPDKSRLSASIYPLSVYGTEVSIRKFPEDPYSEADLIDFGTGNQEIFDFLRAIVNAKKVLIVTGGTASGKTTLLNVALNYLPRERKKVIIENTHELNLKQPHVVYFEERLGDNRITMGDILIMTLRKSPYCIVMGEVRGAEALEMFKAFNTGHFGLGTMHTNGAKEYFDRASTMILMNGIKWDDVSTKKYISSATDYIVHTSKMDDNTKKIVTICEVLGVDQDGAEKLAKLQGKKEHVLHDFSKYGEGYVYLHDVYRFVEEGLDSDGKVVGHWERSKYKPLNYHLLNKDGEISKYWDQY